MSKCSLKVKAAANKKKWYIMPFIVKAILGKWDSVFWYKEVANKTKKKSEVARVCYGLTAKPLNWFEWFSS